MDWRRTTAEQRRTLIARALEAAGRKTNGVPRQVEIVLGKAADQDPFVPHRRQSRWSSPSSAIPTIDHVSTARLIPIRPPAIKSFVKEHRDSLMARRVAEAAGLTLP